MPDFHKQERQYPTRKALIAQLAELYRGEQLQHFLAMSQARKLWLSNICALVPCLSVQLRVCLCLSRCASVMNIANAVSPTLSLAAAMKYRQALARAQALW